MGVCVWVGGGVCQCLRLCLYLSLCLSMSVSASVSVSVPVSVSVSVSVPAFACKRNEQPRECVFVSPLSYSKLVIREH